MQGQHWGQVCTTQARAWCQQRWQAESLTPMTQVAVQLMEVVGMLSQLQWSLERGKSLFTDKGAVSEAHPSARCPPTAAKAPITPSPPRLPQPSAGPEVQCPQRCPLKPCLLALLPVELLNSGFCQLPHAEATRSSCCNSRICWHSTVPTLLLLTWCCGYILAALHLLQAV